MTQKKFITLIAIAFALLTAGCDKLCKKSVLDYSTVQNATGRALTVNVCKGRYGEVTMTVPNDTVINEISLGARAASEVRGGPTASCSDVNNSRNAVSISLAPASFGSVKLCYDDANQRNIIIETSQFCPLGYLEQTTTGPCPL